MYSTYCLAGNCLDLQYLCQLSSMSVLSHRTWMNLESKMHKGLLYLLIDQEECGKVPGD